MFSIDPVCLVIVLVSVVIFPLLRFLACIFTHNTSLHYFIPIMRFSPVEVKEKLLFDRKSAPETVPERLMFYQVI